MTTEEIIARIKSIQPEPEWSLAQIAEAVGCSITAVVMAFDRMVERGETLRV